MQLHQITTPHFGQSGVITSSYSRFYRRAAALSTLCGRTFGERSVRFMRLTIYLLAVSECNGEAAELRGAATCAGST
jgi:hypothetical protein